MTMKELVEEAEELAKFEAHVSDLAALRLQNLRISFPQEMAKDSFLSFRLHLLTELIINEI